MILGDRMKSCRYQWSDKRPQIRGHRNNESWQTSQKALSILLWTVKMKSTFGLAKLCKLTIKIELVLQVLAWATLKGKQLHKSESQTSAVFKDKNMLYIDSYKKDAKRDL